MADLGIALRCASCGTGLSQEGRSAGLCPGCLLELALDDTSLEAELLAEPGEAPTLQFTPDLTLSEGQIQGDRYRIRSLLGRGGMGEVWRAYDLKLRQDVALKALRKELISERQALETLRQEVRVAREVISPNVCRVYDLEEIDGQELISMECVDGTTLQEILRERGPLDLNEAREIASQFLAGLEAIHEAGLVHRDIKPENLMITRTGRVVVMDFGIAKGLGEAEGGFVAGTPAYMAPEQSQGKDLDARADLFSVGVVLAEMVEPAGMGSFEDRRRVWKGIQLEIPKVADTPWSKVITKSVTNEREERFPSASALARALEEVTLRAAGDETARPYPGLSAFQEEDTEFFYGRELEVEALWKKLRRPHLLAVIGPSGAGKSSFLRAGLLPTLTHGWRAVIATPGNRPFTNLARALAEQLSGDPATVDAPLGFEDPDVAASLISQWRQECRYGLIILDQFEELFTQNPEEVQSSFAELLGDLPLKADVHVLLSLRDDFLFHCSNLESLAPVFSELSPLKTLSGASLRRALVEPALKCGYRFENEGTVEEMLSEVEGQHGALPLLAFTAAQLWERRDRETGLLTHKSYQQIGGVGGALAQHAEAILESIGESNTPIVRELFRNLVTAQGTRAARDREELLSVFSIAEGEPLLEPLRVQPTPTPPPRRPAAKHVLNSLIDARLLTSYEIPPDEEGGEPHHRIEIVHESLLTRWPRLVRWQRQDADGAQLRDELRHQARLWEEKRRPEDLLWTGTSYKEFELWRERYPGSLTVQEEEFSTAMTACAEKTRRRFRLVVTAVVLLALVVAATMGGLWWRSEAEARRAEASKLLALAQLRFEEDPTEALAYTTESLDLADTDEARVFAVRVLWEAPPALELPEGGSRNKIATFSPDGDFLAVGGNLEHVSVFSEKGGPPTTLPTRRANVHVYLLAKWASNKLLVTGSSEARKSHVWKLPEGELLRTVDLGGLSWWHAVQDRLHAEVRETDAASGHEILRLRSWRLPDGEVEELGTVDRTEVGSTWSFIDSSINGWVYGKGNSVFFRPLPVREGVPDRFVGSQKNDTSLPLLPTKSGRVWTRDSSTDELRLWDLSQDTGKPLQVVHRPLGLEAGTEYWLDPSGRWAGENLWITQGREARLWQLTSWREARPLTLRRSGSWAGATDLFHPLGDWFVASKYSTNPLSFWPLRGDRPLVVDGYSQFWRPLAFSPDGKWLATSWVDNRLRLWPLPSAESSDARVLELSAETTEVGAWTNLVFDPSGQYLFAVGSMGTAWVVPLDGSPPRRLDGTPDNSFLHGAAVSPTGRRVATAKGAGTGPDTLRLWDLETHERRIFDLPGGSSSTQAQEVRIVLSLAFADESTLYSAGNGGVYRWDLEKGSHHLVFPAPQGHLATMILSADRQTALVQTFLFAASGQSPTTILDLATGESRVLPSFVASTPGIYKVFSLDATGAVAATADVEGTIWAGRVSEPEPHLLLGHEGAVTYLSISPDGRWIASAGEDNTLRLWPMPDLDKPPLHTLPHEELIAKLKSLTNIRVVRDPDSAQGWKVTLDPFQGWQEVPTWQ